MAGISLDDCMYLQIIYVTNQNTTCSLDANYGPDGKPPTIDAGWGEMPEFKVGDEIGLVEGVLKIVSGPFSPPEGRKRLRSR